MTDKILAEQVALITGGSRGIGRAICERLSLLGAHIYVNYSSRADAAEETVEICRAHGGTAEPIGFDVSDSGAVDAAFDAIKSRGGRLDILVNNAGISKDGLFVRMKDEDWDQTIDTNLKGAFFCSRAAGRMMMKARYGRIVNISSVVGQAGNAGQIPYVSSKAGMIGLTKAVARELASRNVTVNAVAPGFIETDMTAALDEKLREEHMKGIPLGRFGQASDVAEVVAFLCSSAAGYITGQTIGVNGGMYM